MNSIPLGCEICGRYNEVYCSSNIFIGHLCRDCEKKLLFIALDYSAERYLKELEERIEIFHKGLSANNLECIVYAWDADESSYKAYCFT